MFAQTKTRTAWTYHRHSAEDKQENSVPIQREKAEEFARKHGIEITHEEADEGRSGLSANRPGFERLFKEWVLNPDAPKADYILVHDVSRWGRFQEPDEAAYWTMLCKRQGIQVVYVEEGFPNEDQLLNSSLQTQLKRYMAAEYSRQLSSKVFYGSAKVAEQGYSPGGPATYGLTRVLLDEHKKFVRELKPGEHKVIANQRVTFAPANDHKSAAVKRMFDELTENWRHPQTIAQLLNEADSRTTADKLWNTSKVVKVLSNERYAGTMVYNKTWKRLKQSQRRNPTSEWVRCENAFEGIVTPEQFKFAQERLYWLMPYQHRYGIYRINAARRQFRDYLRECIGTLGDDDRFRVLSGFPIAFGLIFYQDDKAKTCFCISDGQRAHNELLCVALDMFDKHKVGTVYKVPSSLFEAGDFLVVQDNDSKFKDFVVSPDNAEPVINTMVQRLIAT